MREFLLRKQERITVNVKIKVLTPRYFCRHRRPPHGISGLLAGSLIIVDVEDISIEISCSLHIIRLLCCLIECVLCQRYLLWFCCSKTRFPFPDHILLLTDSASNLIGIYYRTNVTKISIPRSDKNLVNNYYIRQQNQCRIGLLE